jgi:hypothetical protein
MSKFSNQQGFVLKYFSNVVQKHVTNKSKLSSSAPCSAVHLAVLGAAPARSL